MSPLAGVTYVYDSVVGAFVAPGRTPLPVTALEDIFVLEETVPNRRLTGPRKPDSELYFHPGNLTTTHPVTGETLVPGMLIEDIMVKGYVRPVVGGLHFKNVVALCDDVPPVGIDYRPLFDLRAVSSGVNTYEFCEARATDLSYRNVGFQGGNAILIRCKGSGLTDFLSPHGSGSAIKTFEAYGCYADDFYTDADPNQQSDNITHNDFCQAQGRLSKLVIVGCANGPNGRPRTSCILLQTNQGAYSGEVTLRSNTFYPAETTGSCVNIPITGITGLPFTLSKFKVSSTGNQPRMLIESSLRSASTSNISENTILETGATLPINNA